MSASIIFALSVILLSTAHYFKMLRWKQFIEIYEPPQEKNLIISLAAGYTLNFFFPFKMLGDILRAFLSGKKMKNGIAFSFSTIVLDRYLDVLTISVIYILFSLFISQSSQILIDTIFYIFLSIFLILIAVITIKYSRIPKIILQKFSSVFNNKIEFLLLLFFWSFISSFRDMCKKINKKKLLGLTAIMWTFYMLSYFCFSYSITAILHKKFGLSRMLPILFSFNRISSPAVSFINIHSPYKISFSLIFSLYLLLSVILLYLISIFMSKNSKENENTKIINLLPHIGNEDKLSFLKLYFSGDNKEYINTYLNINRDISIIKDFSAGSNATTILCSNSGNTFFRKYSFGNDAEKLNEQILWLENHKDMIPLPSIINKKYKKNIYCLYDMPYDKNTVGLFDFIHTVPNKTAWELTEKVLESLCSNLYTHNSPDIDSLKLYIDSKVTKNIKKINQAPQLQELIKFDTININGTNYKNLCHFEKELSFENLYEIFKNDDISNIHGDLTIENIICKLDKKQGNNFYIIDPNTGNIHNSPYLDFGKLLQSLHGNYEFLMRTKEVNICENYITYQDLSSETYHCVLESYKNFLFKNFGFSKTKSIFYHEIIHWLRLMPYKIEKNGKRAVLFYAGMIKVINEVIEMFKNEEIKNEK